MSAVFTTNTCGKRPEPIPIFDFSKTRAVIISSRYLLPFFRRKSPGLGGSVLSMPIFPIKNSDIQENCSHSCWFWPAFREKMSPFLGRMRFSEWTGIILATFQDYLSIAEDCIFPPAQEAFSLHQSNQFCLHPDIVAFAILNQYMQY